ncbi:MULTISPECIES: hypothetical protein [Bacillaceae]|uniref:Uncharacterized protein n=1 Tax=Bacillus infantis TaxID=324767 RepID=A0A5D4SJ35_9BACI|nr:MULTISPECIES: hypothetical protein [Bacillus]MDT0160920.1 hypothetical protein [Bacillus sp. AG4(2022)]MDW2878598.1 hypothetical protein [Bacillus infantis]TYS62194.1 hypothetical protein FZD47_19150 [Bacillus infantis]
MIERFGNDISLWVKKPYDPLYYLNSLSYQEDFSPSSFASIGAAAWLKSNEDGYIKLLYAAAGRQAALPKSFFPPSPSAFLILLTCSLFLSSLMSSIKFMAYLFRFH